MRSPLRVVVLLAVLAVIVLAAVVMRRSFRMPVREAEPASEAVQAPLDTAAGGGEQGEDVIGRALRLAAIDSTRKTAWVDDIPDLDLASLTPAARTTFLRIANGRHCGCGCGFTLAGCRRFDTECEVSGPRASALFDSVRAGQITRADGFPEGPHAR
jgi:hypothetical protein